MSLPSITLRLDFGDTDSGSSGISNSVSLQSDAPTPVGFASNVSATTLNAIPSPSLTATAVGGGQETVPTPMFGIGGTIATAVSVSPTPSLELTSAHRFGSSDDTPSPEGDPTAVSKKNHKPR
jgi:hypothetical protein